MRFGWIGSHMEGIPVFAELLERGAPIVAAFTLTPERAAARSGTADYGATCHQYGVPLHRVQNINDPEALALLRGERLDIAFVIGWSQVLRRDALRSARMGMIGAHASLLPRNRGSAPVNWGLIRGETVAGNTLLWLDEGVDTGDIIDQRCFPVTPYDTCASVYERVALSNRDMLVSLVPRLLSGERPGRPQGSAFEAPLPRRRPADGAISWTRSSSEIYDFIRALTRPYPGAFARFDDKRWIIWRAAHLPVACISAGSAGEVLGAVISPTDGACGQIVRCGNGAIVVLEAECEDGTRLEGCDLSEQNWTGRHWENG